MGETDAINLTINMIRVVTHSCGCSNRLLILLNMDLPTERCLFLCRYLYWYCYCNTSIRLFVTSLLFFVLLFLPVLFVLLAVRGSHFCAIIVKSFSRNIRSKYQNSIEYATFITFVRVYHILWNFDIVIWKARRTECNGSL